MSGSLHVCQADPTEIYINLTAQKLGQQIHLQTGGGGRRVAQNLLKTQKLSSINIINQLQPNYQTVTN
jgi:hypothetical protein